MKKITFLFTLISTTLFGQCPDPVITAWSMGNTYVNFDGTNNNSIVSYEIQYNEGSTFSPATPAPPGVQTFTFNNFPATLTGLTSSTGYYFTIRTICASDTGSWYDNGNNGPDLWTTTSDCPNSLPYFNDFQDGSCWPGPPNHTNNGSPGNWWYYNGAGDNTGNIYAISESWNQSSGALFPDCWVVLGPIDMNGVTDASLSWKVRGVDPNWCQENYSIYFGNANNITVLENSPHSFTETISTTGDACGTNWADRSFAISGYSDSQGYIALRHHGVTDMYQLHIDDIGLNSTVSVENFNDSNLEIYPNPANHYLNVVSNLDQIGKNYFIYDNTGRTIMNGKISQTNLTLDLNSFSEGIYFMSIGNINKYKFIVARN
tara:strand:+ start:1281 stop:2405 length:1125 start_codon:yes stop_codon:yes gene_type:complete